MSFQPGFIFKVLIVSAGLSALIKYGGPTLFISATPTNVLIAVFMPTFVVAIALLWRAYLQREIK